MIVHLRQFEVSSKSGRRIHLHTLQAKPAEARRGEMAKPRVITFPLFSSFSLWSLSKSAPDISIQCWSGSSGKLLIRKTAGGGYRRCQHYASLTCFFSSEHEAEDQDDDDDDADANYDDVGGKGMGGASIVPIKLWSTAGTRSMHCSDCDYYDDWDDHDDDHHPIINI